MQQLTVSSFFFPNFSRFRYSGIFFFFLFYFLFFLSQALFPLYSNLILYADYDVQAGIQCASARDGPMAKLCKNFGEVASFFGLLLDLYFFFFEPCAGSLSRLVREFFK